MSATGQLTHIELTWVEDETEQWLRFGRPAAETILDRRRRVLSFAPGSLFAYVRWASNGYGTVLSRLDILRAVEPGTDCARFGSLTPGAQILLRLASWPRVRLALEIIDAVESAGFDPVQTCPDYWSHVGNRILAGQPPNTYTRARHRAWLLRQRLLP